MYKKRKGFSVNPTGETSSVGITRVDEEKFTRFTHNVRLNLSNFDKFSSNGMYISLMTSVNLSEYVTYRTEYCKRYHKEMCIECKTLVQAATYILKDGIVKVSDVFKIFSSTTACKYKSDKAVRRLMQLPVVIFKLKQLFVTENAPGVDYSRMIEWITKVMPMEYIDNTLNKQTLKSLCELASTESDRKLMKAVATWDMSAKQAKRKYGVDDHARKLLQVQEALAIANDINESVLALAKLENTALLRSVGIVDDIQSDTDLDSGESEFEETEFGEQESSSDQICFEGLSNENGYIENTLSPSISPKLGQLDLQRLPAQPNVFSESTEKQPLLIEGEEVVSESDSDTQEPDIFERRSLLTERKKQKIQVVRRALRKKAKRDAVKKKVSESLLKRKIPKRVSRVIKEHPDVGKDIEDFVKSKRVGADAWRRTGVLTFDGSRTRGKKVTYKRIQEHLQTKYDCNISYGTVVQLCVVRSKRRISARRYKGVARVTCRKSRKGFSIKLNPDAHWCSAFYKGLHSIQLKDGRNKILPNRDDQAGFRMDTTFTHRQGKCITLESTPSVTTRTDFMNQYQSIIQTTSYLFMESDNTPKACVGVVKPHFTFPKNPTQHHIDLEMLEDKVPSHLENKPIECVRVDGATDEGPGHHEVQFLWTERHT